MLDISLKLGISYFLFVFSIFNLFFINYIAKLRVFRLQITLAVFLASYVLFNIFGYIELYSLFFIGLFIFLCFLFTLSNKLIKWIYFISVLLLSIAFLTFILPGFHNQIVIDNYQFSFASSNYRLFFNFDSPLVGLLIILFTHGTLEKVSELKQIFISTYKYYVFILLLFLLSIYLGDSKFDFKPYIFIEKEFYLWFLIMLFCTCVTEEALFRGFLQKNLCVVLSFKYSDYVAILLVSILFGLAHFKYGLLYIVLVFIVSVFYGLVYLRSGNKIESSIFAHFIVNFIRLMFLTYPRPA